MSKFQCIILIVFLFVSSQSRGTVYTYCVPNNQINFNPFRQINDGKDLAYLMFTRPYISTNSTEEGLLSAYEFSPVGNIFRGKVNSSAKWSDGSTLSPFEAATGILRGFLYRPIGGRVKANSYDENSTELSQKKNKAIKIIDNKTFEIHFSSKIDNLTGVIREAISTSSRHNRVWPVREHTISSLNNFVPSEIIGLNNLKISPRSKTISLPGSSNKIKIISGPSCDSADMSLYLNLYNANLKLFDSKQNPAQQAALAVLNTKTLDIKMRQEIGKWIRHSCNGLPREFGMTLANSFFLKGEPGYSETKKWADEKIDLTALRKYRFVANAEIPVYQEILERAAKRDGINIDFRSNRKKDVDFQIISTAVIKGRLVFLQDYLKWNFASSNFLNNAPLTEKSLKSIALQSAATMPPDNVTLQKFESAANLEWSIIPLVRRNTLAFSKKTSPFQLTWTNDGDLRIGPRENN